MPKPFTGVSANGHHHHFTLIDDEGNNVFHDPSRPGELSEIARHFLGGMLEHFPALCRRQPDRELLLPHVGLRLLGADLQELGLPEPHATVRVASGGRFEYRGVDSILQPVHDGCRAAVAGPRRHPQKADPGEPRAGIRTAYSSKPTSA